MVLIIELAKLLFQSTLPHGSDSILPGDSTRLRHFNPRSLTGATSCCSTPRLMPITFQSTLPHGSDSSIRAEFGNDPHHISIHAPSRERLLCFGWFPSDVRFQSTLPHGSDSTFDVDYATSGAFQSTLPHGSDINPVWYSIYKQHFNPRSLTGATSNAFA